VKLRTKIDSALRGAFSYQQNLERLGPQVIAKPENPATPTLGHFASSWLDERRAQLSAATAYDYLTILRTHILPSKLSEKRLDAMGGGDRRANEALRDRRVHPGRAIREQQPGR